MLLRLRVPTFPLDLQCPVTPGLELRSLSGDGWGEGRGPREGVRCRTRLTSLDLFHSSQSFTPLQDNTLLRSIDADSPDLGPHVGPCSVPETTCRTGAGKEKGRSTRVPSFGPNGERSGHPKSLVPDLLSRRSLCRRYTRDASRPHPLTSRPRRNTWVFGVWGL